MNLLASGARSRSRAASLPGNRGRPCVDLTASGVVAAGQAVDLGCAGRAAGGLGRSRGSSLVLYRTLWVPGGSAAMIAEALGNRLENLPGLRLLVKRTETVGGHDRRAG